MGQIAIWGSSLLAWVLVVVGYCAVEELPRATGRATRVVAFKLPEPLPQQLKAQWTVEVGAGQASPVVSGDKVYLFSRREDNEVLTCFALADGKQLWQQSYPAPYEVPPAGALRGKGPKSTPVVAGPRVFTFGISGILSCWNAKTGKLAWQKEFSKQFAKTAPPLGATMSPAIDDDKCIVHVGGSDKGALVALDVKNGETLWSHN